MLNLINFQYREWVRATLHMLRWQCLTNCHIIIIIMGHLKNIHIHSCKHKTVKLKLALTLTLTLTDTGGAVLTLMLGYRRLRIYKLKWKI